MKNIENNISFPIKYFKKGDVELMIFFMSFVDRRNNRVYQNYQKLQVIHIYIHIVFIAYGSILSFNLTIEENNIQQRNCHSLHTID